MKTKSIAILLPLAIALGVIYMLFVHTKPQNDSMAEVTVKQTQPSLQHTANYDPAFTDRSEPALKKFWAEYLDTTYNQIFAGTLPYPEVQERIIYLVREINSKHGNINTSISTTYHNRSKMVFAGAVFKDGVPTIEIIIQMFMDTAEVLRRESVETFKQKIQISFVESVHHELEHLYYDGDSKPTSNLQQTESEARAWGQTCTYVIVPMVEKYNISHSPDSMTWYKAWVLCGRDATLPRWKAFVGDVYSKRGVSVEPRR